MDGLWGVLAKVDNVAVLVLVLALLGLGYLYVITLRENRADRAALMELLLKNTEALNGMKNVISAMLGKAL